MLSSKDLKDCGVTPELMRAVLRRKGVSGLRTIINNSYSNAVKQLHPDALKGTEDAMFMAMKEAITNIRDADDSLLADFVKRYKVSKNDSSSNVPSSAQSASSGKILAGVVETFRTHHACLPYEHIPIRAFATEDSRTTQANRLSVTAAKSRIAKKYSKAKRALLDPIDDLKGQISTINSAVREAQRLKRYSENQLRITEELIDKETLKIEELQQRVEKAEVNTEMIPEDIALEIARARKSMVQPRLNIATSEEKLPAIRKKIAEATLALEKAEAKRDSEMTGLQEKLKAAQTVIQGKISDLDKARREEEAALQEQKIDENTLKSLAVVDFLIEPISNGIRYSRGDDNWQVEEGIFIIGTFHGNVSVFLKKHAHARTTNHLDAYLIGTTTKVTGVEDPIPRVPIAPTFFAGVGNFYSPLISDKHSRTLAAVDQFGNLVLLGTIVHEQDTESPPEQPS